MTWIKFRITMPSKCLNPCISSAHTVKIKKCCFVFSFTIMVHRFLEFSIHRCICFFCHSLNPPSLFLSFSLFLPIHQQSESFFEVIYHSYELISPYLFSLFYLSLYLSFFSLSFIETPTSLMN